MRTALTLFIMTCIALPVAQALPPYKCMKHKIKSAIRAKQGDFLIPEGLAVAKRSGNIERTKLKFKGCRLDVTPGDNVMLVFPDKAKDDLRRTLDFEMQCVDADKPNGKFLGYDVAPKVGVADGKAWTPPCGAKNLNKLEKKACSKGISNRDRHSHFKEFLKKKKVFALDFYVIERPEDYKRPNKSLVSGARERTTAAEVAPSGKIYCQWFHKKTKKVLFVLTYDVPK